MEKAKHPDTINMGPFRDKDGRLIKWVYDLDENAWSLVKCEDSNGKL